MGKRKFECSPYINDSNIGEIEVVVELTDEEIKSLKSMSKKDYDAFIKSKATVIITDFSIDFDVEDIDEWDEIND